MKYQSLFSAKSKKNYHQCHPLSLPREWLRFNKIERDEKLQIIIMSMFLWINKKYEPAQDKTCNKTCVTSKDADQPLHATSKAMVFLYSSLDSLEAVEGTCEQQRL